MLIAKSTWVPVGKFPRETVQTDPWCATRSSLRGAIWRPSLRLSDKAAHLVNWHAGLQPCGRRGAGVPDAVPYMLLGMPSPDRIASELPNAQLRQRRSPQALRIKGYQQGHCLYHPMAQLFGESRISESGGYLISMSYPELPDEIRSSEMVATLASPRNGNNPRRVRLMTAILGPLSPPASPPAVEPYNLANEKHVREQRAQ